MTHIALILPPHTRAFSHELTEHRATANAKKKPLLNGSGLLHDTPRQNSPFALLVSVFQWDFGAVSRFLLCCDEGSLTFCSVLARGVSF